MTHHIGFRYFKEGISKLKQVTGREHRNIEQYIIPVIAGAVPRKFLTAICALMDFRYLAQAPIIDDNVCEAIMACLNEFHENKDAILAAGARVGKGNQPINNWYIPKAEMLHGIVLSIKESGAVHQWSADITEHCHVTKIKHPAHSGNNQHYKAQICRSLDHTDKIRRFDLAISLRPDDTEDSWVDDDEADEAEEAAPVSDPHSSSGKIINYFEIADNLARGNVPKALLPYRTFCNPSTAFHLTRDATYRKLTIGEAATKFNLPDLHAALASYLTHTSANGDSNALPAAPIGGRRTSQPQSLLCKTLQVWSQVLIQRRKYHKSSDVANPRTVVAEPPSEEWPCGHFDTVLANTDPSHQWPVSRLSG